MSTGAGKGDSPRPVNGERYRTNFDRIFRGNADRLESCMDRFNDECSKAGFDPYRDYPTWICADCGEKHGRRPPGVASWHMGTCDICGKLHAVTEPRDYGHLNWPINQQTNEQ